MIQCQLRVWPCPPSLVSHRVAVLCPGTARDLHAGYTSLCWISQLYLLSTRWPLALPCPFTARPFLLLDTQTSRMFSFSTFPAEPRWNQELGSHVFVVWAAAARPCAVWGWTCVSIHPDSAWEPEYLDRKWGHLLDGGLAWAVALGVHRASCE